MSAVVTPTTRPRRRLLDLVERAYLSWRLYGVEQETEAMKRELRNRELQLEVNRKYEQALRVRLAQVSNK